MRRARVFGVALLLGPWLACARDDSGSVGDVEQVEQVEQVGHVEVPAPSSLVGAWVRVSQQRLLSAPNRDARLEGVTEQGFQLAEVVAVEGEFVKLKSLVAKDEDLCATTSGSDEDFELYFFAELDALEPVLAKPTTVEFDDGTKLEFAAGVPVDQTASEPRLKVAEGASFVVPLAADEVGRWFPPAPEQLIGGRPFTPDRKRLLRYGQQSFEFSGPPFRDILERQSLGENGVLLTFADACGRFTLRVDDEPPEQEVSGVLGVMVQDRNLSEEESVECVPVWTVDAGVEVTWFGSDTVAGVSRFGTQLPGEAREVEGKICFSAAELPVCVASDKLVREEAPNCENGVRVNEASPATMGRPVMGDASKRIGRVDPKQAQVSVGLDRDIVRRIVRAHINELRGCYNDGLREYPGLTGSVTIAFEIGANGKVASSTVQASALAPTDDQVPKCMAQAIKRWQFPKPERVKQVSVTYPFELSLE
jgi:hypothetical protein